jgi:PAS domain S-box-containing protein
LSFSRPSCFFATAQGQNKDLLDSIDRHLGIWQRDQNSPYFSILKRWGPAAHHTAIPTAIWWTLGTIALLFALASTTTVIARREVARQTKSLRASEARFRGVFDAVSEGILIHERTTGKLLQVNQRTCEMFGCTESEVIGSSIERLSSGIPPYSSQEANGKLKQAADSGPQNFIWQGKRLDNNELFWIDVNLRRTRLGDQDCILAVVRERSQEPAGEA